MQIHFQSLPSNIASKVIIYIVCEDMKFHKVMENFNSAHKNFVTKFFDVEKKFKGKAWQSAIVAVQNNEGEVATLIFIGGGAQEKLSRRSLNMVGANITSTLNRLKIEHADIYVEATLTSPEVEDMVTATAYIAEGIKLRNYCFNKYFVDKKEDHELYLKSIQILVANSQQVEKKFERFSLTADGVNLTRNLVTEPANVIYPESFAKKCEEMSKLGLKVKILMPDEMLALGMGALMGVAQGSNFTPRIAIMEWWGDPRGKDIKPLALIGKGVTFDTGGINLKSSQHIASMKYDMGGAGVVAGTMHAIAEQKVKQNVVGFLGLVENMPSGHAQRPSDVVKTMSGQTVEVDNTDAEGRLVLADVIWYAQEKYGVEAIIDLATLTGAVTVALGEQHAGLFSNDDDMANKLLTSGKNSGELLWRLPLSEYYDTMINSEIADVKNTGKNGAGATTAAQFLKRFVKEKTKWTHLDIAGVTWSTSGELYGGLKGATGFGVRLLEEFITNHYSS